MLTLFHHALILSSEHVEVRDGGEGEKEKERKNLSEKSPPIPNGQFGKLARGALKW